MQKTKEGYVPAPGFLQEQMPIMPALKCEIMPEYDIHENDPLLASSNMTPEDWFKIAQDIADHYDQYDGFIVLHGTDTMAYNLTLAQFLHGLALKPTRLARE